jgi:hypothetical protein
VAAEGGFKRGGVKLRGMGRGWGDVLRHRLQTSSRMRALGARGDRILCGADFSPHKMLLPPGSSQVIGQRQG